MAQPTQAVATTGLTVLYQPEDPCVDIVFIHGFNGHPERTWTYKKPDANPPNDDDDDLNTLQPPLKSARPNIRIEGWRRKSSIQKETYWPRDLLPRAVDKACVLTYGYDTAVHHRFGKPRNSNTVYDFAEEFLNCLSDVRQSESLRRRPIVFVAHSLGGIVTKEALRQAGSKADHPSKAHLYDIFMSTIGIVFFGTPHRGSDPRGLLQHVAERVFRAAGFTVNEKIFQTLMPDSERLKQLLEEFPPLAEARKWQVVCFKEMLGMKALNGNKLVDNTSSCLGLSFEIIRDIESDHREMCQFSGLNDPRYTKVIGTLQRLLQPLLSQSSGVEPLEEPRTSSSCPTGPDLKIEERISDADYKEILGKLHFKQMDVRLLTLKSAQAKTCKWLLTNSHYKDWTDRRKIDEHHGFFWIKGKPGTGKSTMMKYLFGEAKRTMKKSIVISFFFNARGSQLEKSTTGLYRSLLLQLLEKSTESRRVFNDYGSSALDTLKNTTDWSNELLQDLFTQALVNIGTQQVVCYIDALDECPEDDVREMISFLEGLGQVKKEVEFRVCFSSRHYPEISIRTGLQLVLESEENHRTDIALFIDARLHIGTIAQAQEIKDEILRKSSNIFLWVVLVVLILNKEFDRGRIKALKKRLGEIPLGLHDLFLNILTRDQRNMDEMLVCIQSVLFCTRPLKPEELQIAVEIGCDPDQMSDQTQMTLDDLRKFVLDTSKGLAELTIAGDPTVQFIHESVRDFLLREGGLQQLFPHENDFEARRHDTLKNICSAPQLQPPYDESPLRAYAVENLFFHADRAQQGGIDQSEFLGAIDMGAWSGPTKEGKQKHTLYHLAEGGFANLIRIHPERQDHLQLELQGGRYRCPLIAALYGGHYNAVRALVGLTLLYNEPYKAKKSSRATDSIDKRRYSSKRHIYTYLCEFGDIGILEAVLTKETGKITALETDYIRRQCLEYASNESVVNLILEFLPPPAGDIQHPALFGLPSPEERVVVENFPGLSFLVLTLQQDPALLERDQYWGKAPSLLVYATKKRFQNIVKLCIQDEFCAKNAVKVMCSEILDLHDQRERHFTIHVLLDAGVNLKDAQEFKTGLLHKVVKRSEYNTGILKRLLSSPNINIEEPFQSYGTPLLMAIRDRQTKHARVLLEAGANPMAQDVDRNAALFLAVDTGSQTLFELILNNPRCLADAQNHDGQTALFCAIL